MSFKNVLLKPHTAPSLKTLLVVGVVVTVGLTASIVHLSWWWTSKRNVDRVIDQVNEEVVRGTSQAVGNLFSNVTAAENLLVLAFKRELVNLYDPQERALFCLSVLEANPSFTWVEIGYPDRSVVGAQRLDNNQFNLINRTWNPSAQQVDKTIETLEKRGDELERIDEDKLQEDYNVLERPWYKNAIANLGKATWSDVYLFKTSQLPGITSSLTVNQDDRVLGVVSISFNLTRISEFLQTLQWRENSSIFILNSQKELIATSEPKEVTFLVEPDDEIRLKRLEDVEHLQFQFLVQALEDYELSMIDVAQRSPEDGILTYRVVDSQQYYYVSLAPIGYLDWVVVTIIPESNYLHEIHEANTRTTVGLLGVTIILAIATSYLAARWISEPIARFTEASQLMANAARQQFTSSNFVSDITINGLRELNILGRSFNQMAKQLKAAFKTLETVNEELEKRVEERTAELTAAKETADAANRAKSTFIANMSHELRTPLNVILGFSQLMVRSKGFPEKYQENLRIISNSGEYLLNLINNVLDLSKIEAGKTTLNPNPFDLYHLLDEVEDLFRFKAESKELDFHIEVAPGVPQYVNTDETKLRQVLINLLSNAIKFTVSGGVTVTVKPGNTSGEGWAEPLLDRPYILEFVVQDTGLGMAPEELQDLFEAFTQTQTGRDAHEGTGLGLAISRKFVELMGGKIRVESQVEVGTIFTFQIQVTPIAGDLVEDQGGQREVVGLLPGQRSHKLLIVDDRATNRLLLSKLLAPLEFELREASNGKEAIALWQDWQPDLIWMDMRMPGIDGYEITQWIKSRPEGRNTVIVAVTASALEEDRALIRRIGCDDFVRKPFRAETIFETLTKHLGVRYCYREETPSSSPLPDQFTVQNPQEEA